MKPRLSTVPAGVSLPSKVAARSKQTVKMLEMQVDPAMPMKTKGHKAKGPAADPTLCPKIRGLCEVRRTCCPRMQDSRGSEQEQLSGESSGSSLHRIGRGRQAKTKVHPAILMKTKEGRKKVSVGRCQEPTGPGTEGSGGEAARPGAGAASRAVQCKRKNERITPEVDERKGQPERWPIGVSQSKRQRVTRIQNFEKIGENRGQTKRFGGFFVRKPTAVQ